MKDLSIVPGTVVPAYELTKAEPFSPATKLNAAAVLPLESDGWFGDPTTKGLQPKRA